MDDERKALGGHLRGRGRSERYPTRKELEALEKTPEWMAIFGTLSGEQYLARYGYSDRPIETIDHDNALVGPPKPRHLRR